MPPTRRHPGRPSPPPATTPPRTGERKGERGRRRKGETSWLRMANQLHILQIPPGKNNLLLRPGGRAPAAPTRAPGRRGPCPPRPCLGGLRPCRCGHREKRCRPRPGHFAESSPALLAPPHPALSAERSSCRSPNFAAASPLPPLSASPGPSGGAARRGCGYLPSARSGSTCSPVPCPGSCQSLGN